MEAEQVRHDGQDVGRELTLTRPDGRTRWSRRRRVGLSMTPACCVQPAGPVPITFCAYRQVKSEVRTLSHNGETRLDKWP